MITYFNFDAYIIYIYIYSPIYIHNNNDNNNNDNNNDNNHNNNHNNDNHNNDNHNNNIN